MGHMSQMRQLGVSSRSKRRGAGRVSGPLALVAAGVATAGSARASGFEGRLTLGPSYMWNDTKINDSEGPALSLQADAGVRVRGPFALVATVFYDRSSWLAIDGLTSTQDGS